MAQPQTKRRGESVRSRTKGRATAPKPGRQHTSPLAVLYQEGKGRVCAALMQPSTDTVKIEQSRGMYSALGLFIDVGYKFGTVKDAVPEWAVARIPQNCRVLGCARITGFPL